MEEDNWSRFKQKPLPKAIVKHYPEYKYPEYSNTDYSECNKIVYIYSLAQNYRFDKEYFASSIFQFDTDVYKQGHSHTNSPLKIYIGCLKIPSDSKVVSFAHNIIKSTDVPINEIFLANKEEYLNNAYTGDVSIINKIEYNCDITYIEPNNHNDISHQNKIYTYVNNLKIIDLPITYFYLYNILSQPFDFIVIKKLAVFPEHKIIHTSRGCIEIEYPTEEYYIEKYNIAFNTEDSYNKYTIIFDTLTSDKYINSELIKEIVLNREDLINLHKIILSYAIYNLNMEKFKLNFIEKENVEYDDEDDS